MHDIILGRPKSENEKYGTKGSVFIGKQYVQMGENYSLSNPIYMDVSRAHAMLVLGKRGGGKCVHPDTKILLSNGKKEKISDLFEIFKTKENKIERADNIEEYICNKEIFIKTFNEKKQSFEDKKITNVYRRKIDEEVVRWVIDKKNTLITTKDHKILFNYEHLEQYDDLNWYSYNDLTNEEIGSNFCQSYIQYDKNVEKFVEKFAEVIEYEKEDFDLMKMSYQGYIYDISVEDNHNFIANDIIVHNSYTMGSIAEGLADMDPEVSKNLAFMMLDTMGVYWSMKYPNKKDDSLLKKWGLEGKGLDVQIYVPGGFYNKYKEDGVPVDFPLYIQPKELSIEDWMNAFKLKTDDEIGVAVQRVINKLLNSGKNFEIDDIIDTTNQDNRLDDKTKLAVVNRFENTKTWGLFSKTGTPIKDIFQGGKVTVIDLSPYVALPGGWEVKALALGIIAKKVFVERMLVRKREEIFDIVNKTQVVKKDEIEEDLPMPWLIVDEAHEFLPAGDEEAPSKQALMTILREGRQPGVSLIMATQQPAKIHTDAVTQSDIVMSHRLTASFDLEALDKVFLSYNNKGSKALFNAMPRTKGCAIIMDDKNERLHTMQVKPRTTWHGGEDPNAIREIKDEFDLD